MTDEELVLRRDDASVEVLQNVFDEMEDADAGVEKMPVSRCSRMCLMG